MKDSNKSRAKAQHGQEAEKGLRQCPRPVPDLPQSLGYMDSFELLLFWNLQKVLPDLVAEMCLGQLWDRQGIAGTLGPG